MLPQGYASPYSINLTFSDLPLVAAGTEGSLDTGSMCESVVHPTGASGWIGASLRREVKVGPLITSAKSTSGKLGKPF